MSKQTELAQVADTITVDSGNVGIGTSSPNANLEVEDNGTSNSVILKVTADDSSPYAFVVGNDTYSTNDTEGLSLYVGNTGAATVNARGTGSQLTFRTVGTERMRIDASGNLLVGTTDLLPADNAVEGFVYKSGLSMQVHRDAGPALGLGRGTSDGSILNFLKDGTTVGSIGTASGYPYLGALGAGGRGVKVTGAFEPANNVGANNDNAMDIGTGSVRWDDIYATNGTIQTSDQNEKQDIAELSDAEQRVAVAAKGLMRKFRWRDAVEAKGDEARTHFGIIAQDLQAAFAAEGLDAGDYAMFISTTWWETQTEVPAVEAVAEVLDDDGNVVTEAVEAKDAYTRTDTYDTQEEAPEGATERTRLGVRYSELLAFIIGAL